MKIQYKNKKQEIELPENSSAKDLVEKLNLRSPEQSVAVEVNGTIRDLSIPFKEGDLVEIFHF